MDTDQILDSVELMAGVDRDGARLAVDATLLTLAERVGRAAAAAARARVDPGRGREYATAVLATLREDVAGIQELRDRLPADYRPLFG